MRPLLDPGLHIGHGLRVRVTNWPIISPPSHVIRSTMVDSPASGRTSQVPPAASQRTKATRAFRVTVIARHQPPRVGV